MQWDDTQATVIIDQWRDSEGPLLPVLRDMQETFGYIDDQAIPLIVRELNIPRAEVYGVITFYHEFRRAPTQEKVLQVCSAEACQAMGSRALEQHLEQTYKVSIGAESTRHKLTVEKVYCLGNCACAPAVQYQGNIHGRASAQLLDSLLGGK